MKFAIKLPSTEGALKWPFPSTAIFSGLKVRQFRNKNAGDIVVGLETHPTRANNSGGSNENEACAPQEYRVTVECRRSLAPSNTVDRGRDQLIQPTTRRERRLTPRPALHRAPYARSDNRRYGVYLPHFDVNYSDSEHARRTETYSEPSHVAISHASSIQIRQVRARTPRHATTTTYRAEDKETTDPPPQYSALDPHPFSKVAQSRYHNRGRVSSSFSKGMGDMSKLAKDLPAAVKDAQAKVKAKRAKGKMRWLERHNFLSAQDRLLSEELRG